MAVGDTRPGAVDRDIADSMNFDPHEYIRDIAKTYEYVSRTTKNADRCLTLHAIWIRHPSATAKGRDEVRGVMALSIVML